MKRDLTVVAKKEHIEPADPTTFYAPLKHKTDTTKTGGHKATTDTAAASGATTQTK
jgi:hypothetical protein